MGLKLASPWPRVVSVLHYIRVRPLPHNILWGRIFFKIILIKTEQHNQVYFDTPQVFVAAARVYMSVNECSTPVF